MDKYGYIITLEDYQRIIELAKANGKQPGDRMDTEFLQVIKEKKERGEDIKFLGDVTDTELLEANLRENGIYPKEDKDE